MHNKLGDIFLIINGYFKGYKICYMYHENINYNMNGRKNGLYIYGILYDDNIEKSTKFPILIHCSDVEFINENDEKYTRDKILFSNFYKRPCKIYLLN